MSGGGELVDGVGCWARVEPDARRDRPALFLDRDGVIVEEVDYLHRVRDVALIPGGAAVVAAARAAGWAVVVVTNQSGVARGRFGWPEFEAVQAEMARQLRAEGARLDAAFACGFHDTGRDGLGVADHPWRKPEPGMLHAAAARLGLDLAASLIVGDKAGDLAAGRAAGLALGVHVATGHGSDPGEREAALALAAPDFAVRAVASLADAAAFLPDRAGEGGGDP